MGLQHAVHEVPPPPIVGGLAPAAPGFQRDSAGSGDEWMENFIDPTMRKVVKK